MDRQHERWREEFCVRLQAMHAFFVGLNPELSEQQALRELLEENEFMVAPLRVRLAELEASHGSNN